jgi:hypothetical protein
VLADQGMQLGHPGHTLGQPGLGQAASRLVLHFDVVVILGPVVPDEQHCGPPVSRHLLLISSPRENYQRPNEQVLTPIPAGTTSHQRSTLPTTGGGTVSHQDFSNVQCV